jgi:thiamine biosynthesis lipoprotein
VLKASLNLLASLSILAPCLSALDRYHASEPHMGSLVSITLYAESPEDAQKAFTGAFARIEELNRILSDYDPQSELLRACDLSAPLSPDLLTVINHAQKLAAATQGAFDISVGPLTRLWREARRIKQPPAESALAEALQRSGYRKLNLENGRLHCAVSGMQLDAGGIAKGYAADEALKVIRKTGITRALVAMSGDIVCGDAPPEKPGWKVAVQNETIILKNAAVSTSGDEFQYVVLNGVRYSHIIDPRTGMALRDSKSISVIGNRGIETDALATAMSVAPPSGNQSIIDIRGK